MPCSGSPAGASSAPSLPWRLPLRGQRRPLLPPQPAHRQGPGVAPRSALVASGRRQTAGGRACGQAARAASIAVRTCRSLRAVPPAPRVVAGSGAGMGASCSLMTRMGSPVISSAACSVEEQGLANANAGKWQLCRAEKRAGMQGPALQLPGASYWRWRTSGPGVGAESTSTAPSTGTITSASRVVPSLSSRPAGRGRRMGSQHTGWTSF
jgi:hypothetical protein